MKHPLQEMMDKRRQGIRCGIPSYCSANELVIEIALRRAKERNIPVLIEATANQVNQFGDRKSTRLNSSHTDSSRMPSSA